jgi:hypothetical protein
MRFESIFLDVWLTWAAAQVHHTASVTMSREAWMKVFMEQGKQFYQDVPCVFASEFVRQAGCGKMCKFVTSR